MKGKACIFQGCCPGVVATLPLILRCVPCVRQLVGLRHTELKCFTLGEASQLGCITDSLYHSFHSVTYSDLHPYSFTQAQFCHSWLWDSSWRCCPCVGKSGLGHFYLVGVSLVFYCLWSRLYVSAVYVKNVYIHAKFKRDNKTTWWTVSWYGLCKWYFVCVYTASVQ